MHEQTFRDARIIIKTNKEDTQIEGHNISLNMITRSENCISGQKRKECFSAEIHLENLSEFDIQKTRKQIDAMN
jgi:hypothetical protein